MTPASGVTSRGRLQFITLPVQLTLVLRQTVQMGIIEPGNSAIGVNKVLNAAA